MPTFLLVNSVMTTFLRSPNIAARVFGLDTPGQVVKAVPRMKFMYFVKFELSPGAMAMTNNANLNTYLGNRGISFKVRQIDKPKITLTTVELNQYNKKKLAYSKSEYGDVSMRVYDTVDDSVLAMWVDYFTYYFGDSRIKSNGLAYKQSTVNSTFIDDSGWGFRPLVEDIQFFDKVTVYAFYANTYTAFSYINPRITTVDWQQKEYSGNDPEEITINFKYEAIQYEEFGKPYNYRVFGWLPRDALRTNEQLSTVPQAPLPRIFSTNTTFDGDEFIDAPLPPNPANMGIQRLSDQYNDRSPVSAAPGATAPVPAQQGTAVFGGTVPQFNPPVDFMGVN